MSEGTTDASKVYDATEALVVTPGLFAGPGEMRARCRAFDWSSTPLGPVTGWPLSLRTTVRTLLASRHPMFLFWGPELLQFHNDAFSPTLGASAQRARALGMRGAEYWTENWEIVGPQIAQIMTGGEGTWHVDQLVPIERNGRVEDCYFTYSYSPAFDDAGQVAGVLVVCQETTQRILGEHERAHLLSALAVERARLAYVFQHAPSFLAVLRGPAYVFTLVNDAYYQLVGHRELLGTPLWEALPEVRGQGFEEHLDRVVATGEPFVGREFPFTVARTPGAVPEERFIDLTYMALVEPDGTRAGVIAHGNDVTEQVLARRQIERLLTDTEQALVHAQVARAEADGARVEAEVANRTKGDFLAVMSHELRTPLNAIGGYTELIELGIHGPVTDAQRTALARIQVSQRHLLGLISRVLDYSRVEAGAMTYRLVDVPVVEAVAEAEALVAPQLRLKGLGYGWSGAPPELCVRADREKLQQILLNLLGNASKFTQARDGVPGRIAVACTVAEADGGGRVHGVVHLHVRDTGSGIPTEDFERVFEPFVQADQRLTRPHDGVGLGLAISRDLARGMGGDLSVESTVGLGSVFTLTLPHGSTRGS